MLSRIPFQFSCHISPSFHRNARQMPPGGLIDKFFLLCYSFRLDLPRVVTFHRAFISGFLLPTALRLSSGSVASVRLLLGHTRKLPDFRFFSSRYGLPHSGQGSATSL